MYKIIGDKSKWAKGMEEDHPLLVDTKNPIDLICEHLDGETKTEETITILNWLGSLSNAEIVILFERLRCPSISLRGLAAKLQTNKDYVNSIIKSLHENNPSISQLLNLMQNNYCKGQQLRRTSEFAWRKNRICKATSKRKG